MNPEITKPKAGYGQKSRRLTDTLFKKLTAGIYDKLIRLFSKKPIDFQEIPGGDLLLTDPQALTKTDYP